MQKNVALLHVIALFHHNIGDLPDAFAEDVRIILWSDFTGCSYDRGQILLDHLAGLHLHDTLIRLIDAVPRDATKHGYSTHTD